MAKITYTVVKGDTLTKIANRYNTTVAALVKLNNIKNKDLIIIGQVLTIESDGTSEPVTENYSTKPVIELFGLQSNSDRNIYATWSWDKSNTDHYEVVWTYATGDGVSFIGNKSNVDDKQSLYSAPANAKSVSFKVKAVSKTRTVNNKETAYWTAQWSTSKTYYFADSPPSKPSVPTVTLKDYTLTASLDNIGDINAEQIQFQVVKDDSKIFSTGKASITTDHASYSCKVDVGGNYKVRCRAVRGSLHSDWTEYSSNIATVPAATAGITAIKALSNTSVYIAWSAAASATSYDIEYTTKKDYFDSSNEVSSMAVKSAVTHAEITGLESGNEWFFRVRAANEQGESAWSSIRSVTLGKAPSAPTTWSSKSTVVVGDPLILYWVHNSEDGSSQTYAQLEIIANGKTTTHTIQNSTDEDEKDKTSVYTIDTSVYTEGTTIQWRVRTRGILETYSEWSTQRLINVYAQPTLGLNVVDSSSNPLESLTSFPFYISGTVGPNTQKPISYNLRITANESYETLDSIGNLKVIKAGDEVFSRYSNSPITSAITISANDVDLENNVSYTIHCSVAMDSGLTADATYTFMVSWTDVTYSPDAEISYDSDTYAVYIRPYCTNRNVIVPGVTLAVYRREFDGGFTEIISGISNSDNTFITDPHPSLDYARYRVVATDNSTGAISFNDIPGYPIGEKSTIIQWDEEWTNFDVTTEDELEQPPWRGSLLKLPYNIDISDSYDSDSVMVEYIGRSHPVSYYGTQKGHTSNWSMEIDKNDKETLYAIRRLAEWMGNVYVREPSGSGYWANVKVSFSQKHLSLTIPITFSITRVEGGA